MNKYLLLILFALSLFSCEDENGEKKLAPSVIEFEITTYGDLSGGVFGEKHILTRETREYQADDENGTYSTVTTHPDDDSDMIDIAGWGNDLHPQVEKIYIRVPGKEAKNYSFDPENPTTKHFFIQLETTYNTEFRGGITGWNAPDTKMSVTISELTEDRIKGNFTAELVCFNVEMIDGGKHMTVDEEITNVNKPVINGAFDVFRESY